MMRCVHCGIMHDGICVEVLRKQAEINHVFALDAYQRAYKYAVDADQGVIEGECVEISVPRNLEAPQSPPTE